MTRSLNPSTNYNKGEKSQNKKEEKSKGKNEKPMKNESLASMLRRHRESLKKAPKVEATLPVTVTELTKRGFRIHVLDKNFYLSFKKYPWFSDATEEEIRDVVLKFEYRVHWEALDVDFEIEQLEHPRKKYLMPFRYVRGEPRLDLFEKKENRQKQAQSKEKS